MSEQSIEKRLTISICALLGVATLGVFWSVTGHEFLDFDDQDYITENTQVQSGLTWEGALWASRTGHAGNWHPLTWLSHMLDWQLYGMNAGGHHFTNLLFHIANTILLFLVGNCWKPALLPLYGMCVMFR